MSILIKGMKMPKCCAECLLNHNAMCSVKNCMVIDDCYEKTAPWCPLIEVPPHGRLIDADALREAIKEARKRNPEIEDVYNDDYFIVADWLRSAPTIIPAEEGE